MPNIAARWGWLLAAALLLLSGARSVRGRESRPPNIVLVFADDLGYGDLGCYGARGWKTPNLDRLARQGMRFTDFYVAQAVCSASRTALLTGCYPNRVGILGALGPASRVGISDRETTLAQLLKTRGYATAIYGKWHLGYQPQFLPTRHGFDEYYGLPYSNDMWPNHPTAKFPDLPLIEGEKTIALNPDQTQLSTAYTEHAVSFINRHRDGPFFLYVPHTMPHVPLHVSAKYRGKSEQGLYGDVIEEIDWSVGEMVKALARNGLERNTLVIFLSDNGPWLSYGSHAGGAGPLREGKGTSFEGGIREPAIFRWPGHIPAGRVCREPAMTIDVLPTLAGITGAQVPGDRIIDGRDIRPLLEGRWDARSPHEAFYFYWNQELQGIRSGRWKLHLPHTYTSLDGKPGGESGKPALYVQKRIEQSLFDLKTDSGETTDVVEQHPDVEARLLQYAEEAREDLGDSLTKRVGKNVREPGRL
jgi:arylsulfatase A